MFKPRDPGHLEAQTRRTDQMRMARAILDHVAAEPLDREDAQGILRWLEEVDVRVCGQQWHRRLFVVARRLGIRVVDTNAAGNRDGRPAWMADRRLLPRRPPGRRAGDGQGY